MLIAETNRQAIWSDRLKGLIKKNTQAPTMTVQGRLVRMVGLTLEAVGCRAAWVIGVSFQTRDIQKSKQRLSDSRAKVCISCLPVSLMAYLRGPGLCHRARGACTRWPRNAG